MIQDPDKRAEYEALYCKDLPPKRERVRRPVDGKPVGRTEHQEQVEVVGWWNTACGQYHLPNFALFAVPNGGARDAITGARLKAEGVRRGALDLVLAWPVKGFHGLFIEMKVGDNQTTEEQRDFIDYLDAAGYKTAVHWTAAGAIREIERYLA